MTEDQIRAVAPEGYVKVVVMFREGQGGSVGSTMMAYAQYRGWREARAAVSQTWGRPVVPRGRIVPLRVTLARRNTRGAEERQVGAGEE